MKNVQTPIHFEKYSRDSHKMAMMEQLAALTAGTELAVFAKLGPFNSAEVASAMQTARVLTRFKKAGQQVFALSRDMQSALAASDISAVPAEYLRLPYKTIYIALENCEYETQSETGYEQLRGFYVTEGEGISDELKYSLLAKGGIAALELEKEHMDRSFLSFVGWGATSISSSTDDTFWFTLKLSSKFRF
jgi:hypothetical protein